MAAATDATLDFARLAPTYENALHLLSLLPTNRDVTSLFEKAAAPDGGGASGQGDDDLNARALLEVRAWLARAGYAEPARDLAALRCVHVAGTKGKGSVCAFVTALLVSAAASDGGTGTGTGVGRVGTYLSPHVVSVRERIWLDGQPIERGLFARYVFELWARLSAAAAAADPADPQPQGAHTKPFSFRFLTLLALHVFAREGVRSAVVECGIGGAYDTTNVLPAALVTATAVSRLGIDHVAMLGDTVAKIAWHKAGIFKKGVAAFAVAPSEDDEDDDQAAGLAVLRARAHELGASALYEIPPAAVARWPGVPHAALSGPFQKTNMALAAAAARHHIRVVSGQDGNHTATDLLDPATLSDAACAALARATLRGRCERRPDPAVPGLTWLVDGAHTADSLAAVADIFAAAASDARTARVLLFTLRDRDHAVAALVRALVVAADAAFDDVFFVFSASATAARDAALQAAVDASAATRTHVFEDTASAVAAIQAQARASTPTTTTHVLATGSFVLVREVLQALGEDELET